MYYAVIHKKLKNPSQLSISDFLEVGFEVAKIEVPLSYIGGGEAIRIIQIFTSLSEAKYFINLINSTQKQISYNFKIKLYSIYSTHTPFQETPTALLWQDDDRLNVQSNFMCDCYNGYRMRGTRLT